MTKSHPVITLAEATNLARVRAREKGWSLTEPISIESRRTWRGQIRNYDVQSNPRLRGTRCWFKIDAKTGAILAEGYVAR